MPKILSVLGTIAVISLAIFAAWSKFDRREGRMSSSDVDQIKWISGTTYQNVGRATDVVAFLYDEFNDKVFCVSETYFEANERREFSFPRCPNVGGNSSATSEFMLAKHYFDSDKWKEKYSRNLDRIAFSASINTCNEDPTKPLRTQLNNVTDVSIIRYSGIAVAYNPETKSEIYRRDIQRSSSIPARGTEGLCWPVPKFPTRYDPKKVEWNILDKNYVFQ
ncbi:MAG: hypothetical protein WBB85_04370 [Albidovulum sp.]|uniref:hypothetical protein n=1 Tax=Albidovulum sp. TaxID=1872424 RepID=UPI003CBB0E56